MKRTFLFQTALVSLILLFSSAYAQEWSSIPVPANAGSGKTWQLQSNMSDDFSYNATFGSGGYAARKNFGSNKWSNFYHNAWDGPGYTYWNTANVSVDGDNLVVKVGYTSNKTKGGSYGVQSGCVTSNNKVKYPVYVEASLSVANISLASCFWLLSPDDTEEIDIIENYGGVDYFKNFTHISHHSFVRSPFTDYQPRDKNSWYPISKITSAGGWGAYCWNGGNRRYMRMGVYWISPKHFEYYIDGALVRVMYYNAMATNMNGTWQYTYYNSVTKDGNGYYMPTNGSDGYSAVTVHSTSSSYSFSKLQAASNASKGYNVIDPGWFQGGDNTDTDGNGVTNEAKGFTKELQIIINMESQGWLLDKTPSSADLNNTAKNQMKVDWVRVYKPVASSSGSTGGTTTGSSITIQAESFAKTGGTFNDGKVPYGANKTSWTANYINKDDWMDFNITIPEDGAYEIVYYISSPNTGSTIKFGMGTNVWNTTTVPNNGAWDTYKTLKASNTANFTKGNHTIRISAGGTNWTWNLDKIVMTRVSSMKSGQISTEDTNADEPIFAIFPNPATDVVNIQLEQINEITPVTIYNTNGVTMIDVIIENSDSYTLDVSNLQKGLYFIKIDNKVQKLYLE